MLRKAETSTPAITVSRAKCNDKPDNPLKADKNFRALMDELSGTENRLAVARKDYNDSVQTYNTAIRTLPTSLFAGPFGFSPRAYFKTEEGSKQVPQVKF